MRPVYFAKASYLVLGLDGSFGVFQRGCFCHTLTAFSSRRTERCQASTVREEHGTCPSRPVDMSIRIGLMGQSRPPVNA